MRESIADFIARMDSGSMNGHFTDELQKLSRDELIKVCEVLIGRLDAMGNQNS